MFLFKQNDQTLVSKALMSDAKAWKKLVTKYERLVFNQCFRMVSNADDALDLTQEIFIAVYRNLPSFRGDSSFKTWLMKISHHRIVDHIRKNRQHENIDDHEHIKCQQLTPEMLTSNQSSNKTLMNILASLPAEQRIIIEYKFFHHCTFEEIAQISGISSNTVKTRYYAALKLMKSREELQHAL
jgi:RNA polymerase sigma-70 factor, ECF subfamily